MHQKTIDWKKVWLRMNYVRVINVEKFVKLGRKTSRWDRNWVREKEESLTRSSPIGLILENFNCQLQSSINIGGSVDDVSFINDVDQLRFVVILVESIIDARSDRACKPNLGHMRALRPDRQQASQLLWDVDHVEERTQLRSWPVHY